MRSMKMKLENRVAVVTGGGKGIGRAIGLAFAREGARLVVAGRTLKHLDEVSDEVKAMGREVFPVVADISKKSDVRNLVQRTLDRFGAPDILVNNASVSKRGLIVEHDDDVWLEVIRINLVGTYYVTKYFLQTMIPRKTGRIINMSSIAGKSGQPFNSSYSASKHGIIGLTRTAAIEVGILGAPGITVNAICPGATRTEMLEGEGGLFEHMTRHRGVTTREEAEKQVKGMNIQTRMLDPEEIANLAVYLASDDARGITGQALTIDGGQVMT
jgi:NAD(P)-dependent dehydrogenase (short-subunit alcohol dehydrogenase family)